MKITHRLASLPVLGALTFLLSVSAIHGQAIDSTGVSPALTETNRYWLNAKKEVDRSVLDLIAQHQTELAQGVRFHKLMHGPRGVKEIALTFDDGPHPAYTPRILEILRENHINATFFVVGEMASKSPMLVKEEVAEGNSVGNHTYHHVNLNKVPEEAIAVEIKACGGVLQAITGKTPHLFRPPGGDYNVKVAEVSEALGYTMVLWTSDPGDYASPGVTKIEDRLATTIHPGGIILLHDGIEQTIDLLPHLIKTLKAEGYKFVTIDQMMKDRASAKP
jgi:peptidoglycan/xylan/chitin deacetylase (PgdA/CDA1 family)